MQNSYNLSPRLTWNARHRKFFPFLCTKLLPIHHAAFWLLLLIYLLRLHFAANEFCVQRLVYKVQRRFCQRGLQPFNAEKVLAGPLGARLLEGLREKLRAQRVPSLLPTSRHEALSRKNTREENKSNITKGSFCSLGELGIGVVLP